MEVDDDQSKNTSVGDRYAATASAYDLYIAAYRCDQIAALEALRPRLRPSAGPILDVGAGSGLNCNWVLSHVPGSEVIAIEPSPSMRSLTLQRIAANPDWFPRITVRPEDFLSAPLPASLGGGILLGVLGHFDAGGRAAVFAELATRMATGAAALIDLQEPEKPMRVEPFEFTAARIGMLHYKGIAEAWPAGGEAMRWRMTYLTLEDERILTEETTEHLYHHPTASTVAEEAAQVGLTPERFGQTTYWLLHHSR